jgi:rhamnosyltransferase
MSDKIDASVLILTKNAGPRLAQVLAAVLDQAFDGRFEVVVVDSGSRDGTLELVRSQPAVKLVEIAPGEFGHGRTRNFAAAQSRGEFLVYITHDAVPQGRDWLSELLKPFADAQVAGVFGRHVAHRDADAFTVRDLEAHFANIGSYPAVLSKATDPARYQTDIGWVQLLHFFSNNNSALRRAVWERHPFPDVHFAEDQLWARSIIEAGYAKAYAADAVVAHSHSFGAMSQLRRAFDEAAAFRHLFGYRLGHTPMHFLKTAFGLSARDIAYGRQNRMGIAPILRRVGQDVGLAAGHFLGTHSGRLPAGLRRSLSHDRRLMDSLRTADG